MIQRIVAERRIAPIDDLYKPHVNVPDRPGVQGFSLDETLDPAFCGASGPARVTKAVTRLEDVDPRVPPWQQLPCVMDKSRVHKNPAPWWTMDENRARAEEHMESCVRSAFAPKSDKMRVPFLCWLCGSCTHTYHWCVVTGNTGRCWNCELQGHQGRVCPGEEGIAAKLGSRAGARAGDFR